MATQAAAQGTIFRANPLPKLQHEASSFERPSRPTLIADPVTRHMPSGPTVLMITNGRCPACDRWWNSYAAKLQKAGWTVEKKTGNFAGIRVYPTFRVFDRKHWLRSFDGSMDMNDLRALLGSPAAKPKMVHVRIEDIVDIGEPSKVATQVSVATSGRYTTDELRSMIRAMRPGGWHGPVYADVSPRSQAKQHLIGPEHGFSWDQVAGLTQDEALILHDLAPRHGNKIFPTRGGYAPARTSSTATRRTLFGWKR